MSWGDRLWFCTSTKGGKGEGGRWVVHPQGEPISINIENINLSHWKAKKGPPEKNIHQTIV